MKHTYWEEMYPRLGESHMRLAMEAEALYAKQYGAFIEYGQDIHVMHELEKGVKTERLSRTDYDTLPPKDENE